MTLIGCNRSTQISHDAYEQLVRNLENMGYTVEAEDVTLEGFSKQENMYGNYLFLNVVQGMDEIKNIHDDLYKDKLKQFDAGNDYVPHMTVGKVSSKELLEEAFNDVNKCKDKFSAVINMVSVEMIGEHEESIIIIKHELN